MQNKEEKVVINPQVELSSNVAVKLPGTETTDKTEVVNKEKVVITGEELLNKKMESMPYLIEPLFNKSGVVALAGASDVGKSSFLRQMAMTVVRGEDYFLGFPVKAEHQNVIYVCSEDDEDSISFLLGKQNNGKYLNSVYQNLRFIFDSENIIEKLDEALRENRADAVFIDTFSDLYGGDMNQNNKVRSYLNLYSNLAKKYKCLVVFLHHIGKGKEENAPSKNNIIGSQGFEAKMRLVIELRKDKTDPTLRHLCIVKGNYLPNDFKEQSYVLHFDKNMVFTNTGERVPFDDLGSNSMKVVHNAHWKKEAIRLKSAGISDRKIEQLFAAQGQSISKSTINNWTKNCPNVQDSLEEDKTGQGEASVNQA